MEAMGAYDRTITVEPVGRQIIGPEMTIEGSAPPTNWWPLIIAAGALAVLWYLTREEGGRRPLDE